MYVCMYKIILMLYIVKYQVYIFYFFFFFEIDCLYEIFCKICVIKYRYILYKNFMYVCMYNIKSKQNLKVSIYIL